MAETEEQTKVEEDREKENELLPTYIGLSFSLFLALLPTNSLSVMPKLQNQNKELAFRLLQAEEQLKQMKSRRKEDSKANARVVEIFASHRNAWQAEERRLLEQIEAATEEVVALRVKVEDFEREREEWRVRVQDLEREVGVREEMIGLISRSASGFREEHEEDAGEVSGGGGDDGFVNRECFNGGNEDSLKFIYGHQQQQQQYEHHYVVQQEEGSDGGFGGEFLASASKFWAERANLWQDVQYESLESIYHMKHFVSRRASPWKVDGESTGVSSKLKLLEQELLNLEKVGKTDFVKVPSQMRKQTKRYQTLAGKIDDLCRRMQVSDPCEPTLSPEFRTQRQTDFLLEAFRLQQRAAETGQKLMALQTEVGNSYHGDEVGNQAKITMRRSFDTIRNNLKEVQRNMEIWLARIIGDLEGILARDGASRAREYYISRYPFVQ
ncbi:hypothetical protein K2173_009441 [Erythroxylum novogranatense]|uniref:Uncharacterized protein n=1 Tax=Erythroxylum novogranatense TaxID=1862640 RepID=A0AAV8U432_9ROSI|nr:hypothetical protein K2173_009441 [Erythroxylum novogranatense]